jgi:predicted helicase
MTDLHADLNNSISRSEAIEMLAQHLITKPVFDAMFQGYNFADHNPVSKAMQSMLAVLERHNLQKEADSLTRLYDSVRRRAEETRTMAGKQKLIVELYDKFFQNAFPKLKERLGIVYTPVEVVDFIIHSVNDVLKAEFGQTLGSRNVHIMDPFVGTGTFITRLLQSGLIAPDEMAYKYAHEIHANEIVLLAYYIAAINIEQVYHSMTGANYEPFDGICLTDTFNLATGKGEWHDQPTIDNSDRLKRQRKLDIRVIIGNPPYSVGQERANDNNQNRDYHTLDSRIAATYAKRSSIRMVRALYDSYIRAIRWASDRIGDSGVIGFVTNAGFLDGNAADGLRRCLSEEFANLYVFHLRGNARTSGEMRRREKDNVFGPGSRAPIAISLLVKNPTHVEQGIFHFHDIGDYLSQPEKLTRIAKFRSINGISAAHGWRTVELDAHGDWLHKRTHDFSTFLSIGDKKSDEPCLFETYSQGVKTNRDLWVCGSSKKSLSLMVQRSIEYFNSLNSEYVPSRDDLRFKWCQKTLLDLSKHKKYSFDVDKLRRFAYRPFQQQWLYMDSQLNWSRYRSVLLFPSDTFLNRAICLSSPGSHGNFSVMMADMVSSIHFGDNSGSQCFPLYLYESLGPVDESVNDDLFRSVRTVVTRRDAITDPGIAHFVVAYPGEPITKEDLFYYVYGLLHSEEYRSRFADNLSKELPRIPAVKSAADFRTFSAAGRALAALHVDYETVAQHSATLDFVKPRESFTPADWRVDKMKFAKGRDGARHDKSTVTYNHNVTIRDIPMEAYDYVVNGKPALEWVMERQAVTTDKDSGIVNDANDWAIETINNPAYPFELFLRVTTVSLETMKIVGTLPALDID